MSEPPFPKDVLKEAWRLWQDDEYDDGPTVICRAIMAERERCARIAEVVQGGKPIALQIREGWGG